MLASTVIDGVPDLFFQGVRVCLGLLRQGRPVLCRGMRLKGETMFSLGTFSTPASSAAVG